MFRKRRKFTRWENRFWVILLMFIALGISIYETRIETHIILAFVEFVCPEAFQENGGIICFQNPYFPTYWFILKVIIDGVIFFISYKVLLEFYFYLKPKIKKLKRKS